MIGIIVICLFGIFIVSFYLAYRSLSELEIPQKILDDIKKGRKPPKLWGVIIFLKGEKTVHYSSSSSTASSVGRSKADLVDTSSSKSSDNKSGLMDE